MRQIGQGNCSARHRGGPARPGASAADFHSEINTQHRPETFWQLERQFALIYLHVLDLLDGVHHRRTVIGSTRSAKVGVPFAGKSGCPLCIAQKQGPEIAPGALDTLE